MPGLITYGDGFNVLDGAPCGCQYLQTDNGEGERWIRRCGDRGACSYRGTIARADSRFEATHGATGQIPGHRTVTVNGEKAGALVRSAGRWCVALTAWHGTQHGSFQLEAHARAYVRDLIVEEGPRRLAPA